MGLNDQLKGVLPASPPGIEDPTPPDPTPEPDPVKNEETGHGEGKEKDKERTPENVYRELSRKAEDERAENREFQKGMLATMDRMSERISEFRTPVKPDQPTGGSLDNYTLAQLDEVRGQVPADRKDAFEAYVTERKMDAKVDEKFAAQQVAMGFESQRESSVQEAVSMYPDLADESSNFYKDVDTALRARGAAYSKSNAQAVLDVASYVAARTGYGVRQTANPPRVPGRPNHLNTAPVKTKAPDMSMTEERTVELSAALEGALPKGKKFDNKKMRENASEYIDNAELFIRQ